MSALFSKAKVTSFLDSPLQQSSISGQKINQTCNMVATFSPHKWPLLTESLNLQRHSERWPYFLWVCASLFVLMAICMVIKNVSLLKLKHFC